MRKAKILFFLSDFDLNTPQAECCAPAVLGQKLSRLLGTNCHGRFTLFGPPAYPAPRLAELPNLGLERWCLQCICKDLSLGPSTT